MITNGFTYIAVLVFLASALVGAQKITNWKVFDFVPPVVLLYLFSMILCTLKVWDLKATSVAYGALKNNILFAMIFLMLLRCDIRKVVKLGPKMIGGFFAATISIAIGFVATYALLHTQLGSEAWRALASLCGSWMGGSANMLAIQAALEIGEGDMGYALVIDSIDASVWIMFLLWIINFAPEFNKWTKADTTALEEVCKKFENEAEEKKHPVSFASLFILLGSALLMSALSQKAGIALNGWMGFLDRSTWTVMTVTAIGLVFAMTPIGTIPGAADLSNILLYTVVALLASRASLAELSSAPLWIMAGFMILAIHAAILLVLAKIFKLDLFTCAVASLANIGGTASAPILAGSYSQALVPVGVLMALIGYVIGTYGGLVVGNMMKMFA